MFGGIFGLYYQVMVQSSTKSVAEIYYDFKKSWTSIFEIQMTNIKSRPAQIQMVIAYQKLFLMISLDLVKKKSVSAYLAEDSPTQIINVFWRKKQMLKYTFWYSTMS